MYTTHRCAKPFAIRDPDIVTTWSPLGGPTHPIAVRLMSLWHSRTREAFILGRDIPSRAIADALRYASLHVPVQDGSDFVIRLAGTGTTRIFGRDVTGEKLSALLPLRRFSFVRDHHMELLESTAPSLQETRYCKEGHPELVVGTVTFPVLAADLKSRRILSFSIYSS